ncbi:Methyltransferase domain-containing protein [Cladophialophora immunda]|nr:Methyltransferase domain-containing protein [Cladophialophora immunda]
MATIGSHPDESRSSASIEPARAEDVTILVDEEATERDSAYGDEISAYTASLTSSVNTFMMQYGRIYHSFRDHQGNMLPSDEQEFKRLDLHHALMLWLLDSHLHFAPIGAQPQRVLDLGTGTGNWAVDFADLYPSAEVTGTDLTPIQSTFVPPNLRFIIDDFEDEWAYEQMPFDYIHGRYLASSVRDWPRLVRQSFQNVKPGGWVEFQDWDTKIYSKDGSLTEETALFKFHYYTCGRRSAAGYDSQPGPKIEGWLQDAGFINVQAVKLPIPLGTWPKDPKYKQVGICNYLQFQAGMEGIAIGCLARTADDPWSIEEVQVLLAEARRDMKNPKIHGQYDFYVVYGQKPPVQ